MDQLMTTEEIEKRFGFHKAAIENGEDLGDAHRQLRVFFKGTAAELDRRLPNGRNKSLALTALEEASMWSHKALANDR